MKKPDCIETKEYCLGSEKTEKIVYRIDVNNRSCGFFATFRYILEYLYFSDICDYIPVVEYVDSLYSDTMGAYKENVFDYFFEQPGGVSLKCSEKCERVVLSESNHKDLVSFFLTGRMHHYTTTDCYLSQMADIFKKYIVLNSKTRDFIEASRNKAWGSHQKVLGVHARGTDYRVGYDNHPVFVEQEDYFTQIDKLLSEDGYDAIFLATDDVLILNKFIEKYSDRLLYYTDTYRAQDNVSVAFSSDDRENHNYKLALEVIRDVYTLAECDALVAGISQVNICSQIIKCSTGKKYASLCIIDKGIESSNKIFVPNTAKKIKHDTTDPVQEKIEHLQDKNEKMQEFYWTLLKWLDVRNSGKNIADYCVKHGYKKVAVYGGKELGGRLVDECISQGIEVDCVIDRGNINLGRDVVRRSPDQISDVGADVIVVTAIHYFEEIKKSLESATAIPVVSLIDVLDELMSSEYAK